MRTGLVVAVAFASLLALCTGGARAGITWNPSSNSFDAMTDYYALRYFPSYQPNGLLRITELGVATGAPLKHTVFASLEGSPFEPLQSQPPVEEGRTVTISGQKANLEIHGSAHFTLLYSASHPGNVTLGLDSRIGAVPTGNVALVGDELVRGDLVVTNGRIITKSVDILMIRLEAGDSVVFRVHGPSGSIGDLLADGTIEAELDVITNGATIDSDLVSYRSGASIAVDAIGASRASFSFSGTTADGVTIVDLPSEIYSTLKDHLSVSVGGEMLTKYSGVEELAKNTGAGFAVAEGPSYAEMFLRLGASSGNLVIEGTVPGLNPLMIVAALSSVAVSAVAGVYLFRRKK